MFIAFEGIDGAGKSTIASKVAAELRSKGVDVRFFEKSSVEVSDIYLRQALTKLREIVWPNDDGSLHSRLGEHYWLYSVAAWFSLVSLARKADLGSQSSYQICDHWYFRFVVKYLIKGYSEEWLTGLFAHVPKPDVTILLDIDPNLSWKRRGEFKKPEMGSQDGFSQLGESSYVTYQERIRQQLLKLAQQFDWVVVPQTDHMLPSDTIAKVLENIESRVGARESH